MIYWTLEVAELIGTLAALLALGFVLALILGAI